MSVDGAVRKKQRIDTLSDKIREHGALGIPRNTLIAWSIRNQGLNNTTVEEYLRVLEGCREIFFSSEDGRYRHLEALRQIPSKLVPPQKNKHS